MDISMDDVDIDDTYNIDEALKNYIKNKINNTKVLSEIAQKNLNEVEKQQKQCLELLQKSEKFNSPDLSIKNTWQKFHNKKWIIGIDVENSTRRPAKNINVILQWDCKQDLMYSVKIYSKYKTKICAEQKVLRSAKNPDLNNLLDKILNDIETPVEDELIPSQEIQNNSSIVILLDIPEFIQCHQITIQGIVTYEKNALKYQKTMPNFVLKVSGILSDQFTLKTGDVVKGCEEDFLSVLSTGKFTPVKLVLPEGIYRTLEGILQIDCFFTKIEIPSRELIVVFDGTSEILKYSCVKLFSGTNNVTLITQNDVQLYMLYHHLYTNIPGVIILDKNSEQINDKFMFTRATQSFLEPLAPNKENLKEFVRSFDNQLMYLENHLKKCSVAEKATSVTEKIDLSKVDGDYISFRKMLAGLEYQTDKLFLKVFDKKTE